MNLRDVICDLIMEELPSEYLERVLDTVMESLKEANGGEWA